MKSILIAALCAVSFTAQAEVVKRDTIHKYTIDKQAVEHFDGSQLEGKHISKYIIACKENGNVVEKHHVIYTGNEDTKVIRIAKDNDKSLSVVVEPLIIVDGKEVSKEDFAKVNSQVISHIDVLKAGSKAAIECYGEKGSNGVIVVTTKASESNVSANGKNDFEVNKALIIVDGKEISYEEFAKLKPESRTEYTEKFANMEILRPGSEEAKAYGEKGRNGVVIATTKAAQKKKK